MTHGTVPPRRDDPAGWDGGWDGGWGTGSFIGAESSAARSPPRLARHYVSDTPPDASRTSVRGGQVRADADPGAQRADAQADGQEHERDGGQESGADGSRHLKDADHGGLDRIPHRGDERDRDECPDEPAQDALEDERPADERVRRADESHDFDLVRAAVDRDPDGVDDHEQHRQGDEADRHD